MNQNKDGSLEVITPGENIDTDSIQLQVIVLNSQ